MTEHPAVAAVQARENLSAKLTQCATALQQIAEVLAVVSVELQDAIEVESAAVNQYICSLEAAISRQQTLS